jgi:hypothetical protein
MRSQAEASGVPADALCADVANWLRDDLARMPTNKTNGAVDEDWLAGAFDGGLGAYVDLCREVTTRLWEQTGQLIHDAGSRIYHQPVGANSLGTDLDARVNASMDRLMISPADAAELQAAREGIDSRQIYVPYHGQYDDKETLVHDVQHASSIGADGVSFYAYGLLRDEQLSWIREAVRKTAG